MNRAGQARGAGGENTKAHMVPLRLYKFINDDISVLNGHSVQRITQPLQGLQSACAT